MSTPLASKRHLALDDLRNRLSYITVENGYNSDAGKNIFLGEAPTWGPDDEPAGLAIEIGDDSVNVQGGLITCRVPVRIWAVIPVETEDPLLPIEEIIADIKEAVEIERDGSLDRSLGAIGTDPATDPMGLERGSTRALRRPEGSEYIGASVEYILTFVEQWGGGGR